MRRYLLSLPLAAMVLGSAACFNNLTEADLSDPGIKARIDTKLQAAPDLNLRYVSVNVHAGIVTISGLVDTYREKREIREIVRRTKGVRQDIINLIVQD